MILFSIISLAKAYLLYSFRENTKSRIVVRIENTTTIWKYPAKSVKEIRIPKLLSII